MAEGPQSLKSSRIALAFETAGARAAAPTVYIIPNGKVTPISSKASEKRRVEGNRDPVLSTRMPESFRVSIPMAALIENNGLGELLLATFGTDTPSAQLGTSGAYDHVFTANDLIKSFTIWLWDTLDPQDIRMCVIDQMTLEVDKEKNAVSFTFDVTGTDMISSSTFGSATYINLATDKPKLIPASQAILEYGQGQSTISQYWEKITITSKESPAFGAPGKAAVPAGSSSHRLVVKGDRDTDIQIDFIDMDGLERKRWRKGGDTLPTATAQEDVQALTKFRLRLFGNEIGAKQVWGYAHQAKAGTVNATWGGTYSGTEPAQFEVVCSTAAAADKFKWRKNGGAWSSEVTVTGAAQTLSDGVTITFSGTTGQVLNDTYYGFTFYQRMIEFTSPTNVIEDVNSSDSSDFYRSTVKMFHESGIGGNKPSMTLRNTKSTTYS